MSDPPFSVRAQRQTHFLNERDDSVCQSCTVENDSYSYLKQDSLNWDSTKIEDKIKNKRLISILAFFIIFAMCFVIMYTLRMSDMIDEKGKN